MKVSKDELVRYLNKNKESTPYRLPEGTTEFRFKLLTPRSSTILFPYSIEFLSKQWRPKTQRRIAPKNIDRFLALFNENPDRPYSDYRNLTGLKSKSASAPYFIHLLRKLTSGD